MTMDELRKRLTYLIEKYVHDEAAKATLFELIKRDRVPAKGILAEMEPYLTGKLTVEDRELVHEIVYWFI